jgi:hypothetical protein
LRCYIHRALLDIHRSRPGSDYRTDDTCADHSTQYACAYARATAAAAMVPVGRGLACSGQSTDQQSDFGKITDHDGSSYYDLALYLSVS